jgi:hypothetical protein
MAKRPNLDGVLQDEDDRRSMIAREPEKEQKPRKPKPTAEGLGIRQREDLFPRTVYFSTEENEELGKLAARWKCSRSDIVRACLRRTLGLSEIEIETKNRRKAKPEETES